VGGEGKRDLRVNVGGEHSVSKTIDLGSCGELPIWPRGLSLVGDALRI